MLSLGSAYIKL